ncbi:MAG: tetratricopeptide repeat protein [Desulfobacteraceae bacterium]|jgi:Tfp pilus assembly protein PilF
MLEKKWFVFLLMGLLFIGCGPDTIFVRPGLDTPSQHVANGHQLLEQGKFDAACREFDRAKELDPSYIRAYVGLGVTLGKKGDIDAGMQLMEKAKNMAGSTQDFEIVRQGYEQLAAIKRLK